MNTIISKVVFEIDDIAVCLLGFTIAAGYSPGLISKISRLSRTSPVYFSFRNGHGVYRRALRLATEKEIDAYRTKGITNISEIKSDEITNDYLIF